MTITREQVLGALSSIQLPELGTSLTSMNLVHQVEIADGTVRLTVDLPFFTEQADTMSESIKAAVGALGAKNVELTWNHQIRGRDIQEDDPIPGVANVVVVMSGKGGVGKSTVAANLALALKRMGARVGLLDADIWGPSVPTMMGTMARPTSVDGESLETVERFGLRMMSIGFLLEDPREAIVWRGPMLHGALMQFLKDVHWGKLDYLLLDLPPGTGDIPLTLSQKLKLTGAIIVTTPQEVALQDVYKAVSMCQKVDIPILGVVENQSWFVCDGCNKKHEIFGKGGGQKVAEMAGAPVIAQIPMDTACRKAGDDGTPVVMSAPDSPSGKALRQAAEVLAARIAQYHEEHGPSAPIEIDRSGGQNRRLPVMR